MYNAVLNARCRLRETSNDIYSTFNFILSCLSLHKTKFTSPFIGYEVIIVIYPCIVKLGFLSFGPGPTLVGTATDEG